MKTPRSGNTVRMLYADTGLPMGKVGRVLGKIGLLPYVAEGSESRRFKAAMAWDIVQGHDPEPRMSPAELAYVKSTQEWQNLSAQRGGDHPVPATPTAVIGASYALGAEQPTAALPITDRRPQ